MSEMTQYVREALADFRVPKGFRHILVCLPVARDVELSHQVAAVHNSLRTAQVHDITFAVEEARFDRRSGRSLPTVQVRFTFHEQPGADVVLTYLGVWIAHCLRHISANAVEPISVRAVDAEDRILA